MAFVAGKVLGRSVSVPLEVTQREVSLEVKGDQLREVPLASPPIGLHHAALTWHNRPQGSGMPQPCGVPARLTSPAGNKVLFHRAARRPCTTAANRGGAGPGQQPLRSVRTRLARPKRTDC